MKWIIVVAMLVVSVDVVNAQSNCPGGVCPVPQPSGVGFQANVGRMSMGVQFAPQTQQPVYGYYPATGQVAYPFVAIPQPVPQRMPQPLFPRVRALFR